MKAKLFVELLDKGRANLKSRCIIRFGCFNHIEDIAKQV